MQKAGCAPAAPPHPHISDHTQNLPEDRHAVKDYFPTSGK